MDEKLLNNNQTQDSLRFFSEKEKELLSKVLVDGVRPISPVLAAQFFELFLEGYSCAAIAKNNGTFREADILYLRNKYNWDEQRDRYAQDLQNQIHGKLIKQKLESIEFLTNMLAVTHKEHKEKMLKYLQTGKEDDKPDNWITGPSSYKGILEAIQKLTGEDRITTQKVKSESKVTVESNQPVQQFIFVDDNKQDILLKKLSKEE